MLIIFNYEGEGDKEMIDALVYIVFAIIEGLIIVFFSFGLFRIDVRDYWKEILVTVSTISAATYYYSQNEVLSQYSPFLNIIALFVAMVIVFRISLLYSLYISVTGFAALIFIQFALTTVTNPIFNLSLEEINSIDWLRYSFQATSDLLLLAVSMILRKKRLWFTSVPYSSDLSFKLSKSNLLVLLSSVLAIILSSATLKLDNVLAGTMLSLICLSTLIYIGIQREKSGEI